MTKRKNGLHIATAMIPAAIGLAALTGFPSYGSKPVSARVSTSAPTGAQDTNVGSKPFKNPPEISYRPNENRLRAIIQLINNTYRIPNGDTGMMRQFRGWDPKSGTPPEDIGKEYTTQNPGTVSPGPTLRVRVGDKVEISFLNTVDEKRFPYSRVEDTLGSDFGCDRTSSGGRDPKTGLYLPYPARDKFPNCFHGSSTANIHYHGTHTSPDGVGDNVLVQVIPPLKEMRMPDWQKIFDRMFDSGNIPQKWKDMPQEYQHEQMRLIREYDEYLKRDAKGKNWPEPESLYEADQKMINAGLWPQYLIGAFPNFFELPEYKRGQNYPKAGQAPGTHWYHAHKHGSTSLHILNGLAGALIIEGTYDDFIRKFYGWPKEEILENHEKIFLFQEYEFSQNLEGPTKTIKQVLVNGQLRPTITMKPGEVQLWRLINATEGNNQGLIQNSLFATAGFTFKQTAMDGVQFNPENYNEQPFFPDKNRPNKVVVPGGLKLAAGNRADLLVQAPQTPTDAAVPFKSGPQTLFFVKVVEGSPVNPPNHFPDPDLDNKNPDTQWARMPDFLNDLQPPGPGDLPNPNSPVRFQWDDLRTGTGPKGPSKIPPHFMINYKQFGETGEVIDQCMPLDDTQDWVLENWTPGVAHPFHIHINPFQVIKIETPKKKEEGNQDKYDTYEPGKNYVWQDVIAIPPAQIYTDPKTGDITNVTPGKITIRQKYLDFTGTYVLHCHILAHEDRGMMQLVRVVPKGRYPGGCQDHPPEHH